MEELCRAYWYPLYAYARRRGCSREDAEDLTQGFFARFLERNYLEGLSSDRGRFRAFLLAAFNHFLANEWKREHRQKRGGGEKPLSLDWNGAATRYELAPSDRLSPDRLYDRAWVITLLERVLKHLESECADDGRGAFFEHVRSFLTMERGEIPYAATAAEVGMSEGALRVAVHRLRRRYRELLRQEVAQTLSDPGRVEEELAALRS
ncbi:MAG: sigma-70 family RNA polymerase sigma factor, partial [Verrucomicrobiae bacterium]|nr:sigma-70 family RNA polymerase sigma factor [Verrucomicrobiae bacterium]